MNRFAPGFEWQQDVRIEVGERFDIFPCEQLVVSGRDAADGEASVGAAHRGLVKIVAIAQPVGDKDGLYAADHFARSVDDSSIDFAGIGAKDNLQRAID